MPIGKVMQPKLQLWQVDSTGPIDVVQTSKAILLLKDVAYGALGNGNG